MQLRTKNVLARSSLIALVCMIAWGLYKYIFKNKEQNIDPRMNTIISDANTKWLNKYLSPGHTLLVTADTSSSGHPGNRPTEANMIPTYISVKILSDREIVPADMTVSERLLCACFNIANISTDNIPSVSNPIGSTITMSSVDMTNNNMECVCYRLSYLEVFHALIRRYALYLEIKFDASGGFEINNKLIPPPQSAESGRSGEKKAMAEVAEVEQAIDIMRLCKSYINGTFSLQYFKDTERLPGINDIIVRLGSCVKSTERARIGSATGYLLATCLSQMEENQPVLQQLKDRNLTRLQPTMQSTTDLP